MAFQLMSIKIKLPGAHQLQLIGLIIVAVAPVLPNAFSVKDPQKPTELLLLGLLDMRVRDVAPVFSKLCYLIKFTADGNLT